MWISFMTGVWNDVSMILVQYNPREFESSCSSSFPCLKPVSCHLFLLNGFRTLQLLGIPDETFFAGCIPSIAFMSC